MIWWHACRSKEKSSHLEAIKDEGLVVRAQLQVWEASWPGPAHPHLSCCQYLRKMKEEVHMLQPAVSLELWGNLILK